MAPNKFEKQLKDTLEGRTIAPSQKAWSQLDTALQTQQAKSKYSFWWLGIAATFLGVCLAIYISKNNSNPIQSIVNEVKQDTLIPKNSNTIENKSIVEIKDEKQIEASKTIVKKASLVATTKTVEQSNQNLNPSKKETPSIQNKEIIIPLKEEVTNTVVADQNITTKEATLLLEEAYSEVKAKNNQYQVEKIDANALLEEVEITSEKSLKNRLFHAVKSGYETLKSTVAERNY